MAKSEITFDDEHIFRTLVIIQPEITGSEGHDSSEDDIHQKGIIQLAHSCFLSLQVIVLVLYGNFI